MQSVVRSAKDSIPLESLLTNLRENRVDSILEVCDHRLDRGRVAFLDNGLGKSSAAKSSGEREERENTREQHIGR